MRTINISKFSSLTLERGVLGEIKAFIYPYPDHESTAGLKEGEIALVYCDNHSSFPIKILTSRITTIEEVSGIENLKGDDYEAIHMNREGIYALLQYNPVQKYIHIDGKSTFRIIYFKIVTVRELLQLLRSNKISKKEKVGLKAFLMQDNAYPISLYNQQGRWRK